MRKKLNFKLEKLKSSLSKRPYRIRLDTNNTCNLNCIYCKINDYTVKKEYMTFDQFCYLASVYFPKSSYVSLSCATEPLVTRDFNNFIKKLGEYKVPETHFITNGQLLNDEIITTAILSKLGSLTISNDAVYSQTYELIRGASFDNLMSKLMRIDEIKKNFNSELPRVRVQFTFFEYNKDEIIPFIEKFHSYIQEIYLTHLSPMYIDSYDHPALKRISFEEYSIIKKQALILINKYELGSKITFNQFSKDNLSCQWCTVPFSFRFIMWNGDVLMCDKQIYGNVFSESELIINERINKAFNKDNNYCKILCTQPVAKMKEQ